jgi:hypothetical protein
MTVAEGAWRDLDSELAAWQAAGQSVRLWWRDDDAVEPTVALARLLGLAVEFDVPLALAVVPARAAPRLAREIATNSARVAVLQHGYAHRNHARPGEKKAEFGAGRPASALREELVRGGAMMTGLFGSEARGKPRLPVLVPPWNRIDPNLLAELPMLGFAGLSTYEPRTSACPVPGLIQCNSHVDIMRWQAPRGFLGEGACLRLLGETLRKQREGGSDPAEPCGLLTHHLAHDAPAWDFLARLLARLARHAAVRFCPPAEVFAPQGNAAA